MTQSEKQTMSDAGLTLETRIARSDAVIGSTLDDEAVVMNIDRGYYHGLNNVGARVWDLIEEPAVIGDLCEHLARKYDVAPDQCQSEVLGFLGDLLQRDVIRIIAADA